MGVQKMSAQCKTPTVDAVMEAWQRDAKPPTWAQIVAMKQEHAELRETAARQASLLRGCYARINGLEKDAARLDWLDSNLFAREPDEWDRKYGSCKDGIAWCWVLFAPKGAQGSARSIIDAALEKKHEGT